MKTGSTSKANGVKQPSTADKSVFNFTIGVPRDMADALAKAIQQESEAFGIRVSGSAFGLKLIRAELERRKLWPAKQQGAAA